ncbi:MAG TPA: alpha/beta hydrolase [Desulfobacterales bacterium]|nr:alpha/beta hydrolase [Desulfobacterales bacterium]
MLIIVGPLAACVAVLAVVLLACSPGRPRPFLAGDGRPLAGSISEKIMVSINGVEQGMFITGRNTENPVLLFLHGGPGMPEYFLTRRYPTGLEDIFTVCWWERRGAGLSYRADIPPETMTMDQAIADTLAVTDYLRDRFGQQRIYLMAHSGGSFIGIQAAARAPERFHAYIGMSQMSYQLESENLASTYLLGYFSEAGDTGTVRKLRATPLTMSVPLPEAWMLMRDGIMHRAGVGTTRDMKSVITGVFLASWFSRDYTLKEKAAIWGGKNFAQSLMWDDMISTDLRAVVKRLELPVYFFHGKHDYTVSYALMKGWFGRLEAPLKGFYTFERSAHSPVFEQPDEMGRILREDVLRGTNQLAD